MSEALGDQIVDVTYTLPVKGLEGALARHEIRVSDWEYGTPADSARVPAQRVAVGEPTGQYAVVVNAAEIPYVRIGHRWYQAGVSTLEPTPWPEVRAARVLSAGRS